MNTSSVAVGLLSINWLRLSSALLLALVLIWQPAPAQPQPAVETDSLRMVGNDLYWSGQIVPEDWTLISQLVRNHRSPVKRLVLHNNGGGPIDVAHVIAKHLPRLGIHTVAASGYCNSTCTMIWASAGTKQLFPGASLGFHASSNDDQSAPADWSASLNRMLDWYYWAGFPDDFLNRVKATPHDQFIVVTADTMPPGLSVTHIPLDALQGNRNDAQ